MPLISTATNPSGEPAGTANSYSHGPTGRYFSFTAPSLAMISRPASHTGPTQAPIAINTATAHASPRPFIPPSSQHETLPAAAGTADAVDDQEREGEGPSTSTALLGGRQLAGEVDLQGLGDLERVGLPLVQHLAQVAEEAH